MSSEHHIPRPNHSLNRGTSRELIPRLSDVVELKIPVFPDAPETHRLDAHTHGELLTRLPPETSTPLYEFLDTSQCHLPISIQLARSRILRAHEIMVAHPEMLISVNIPPSVIAAPTIANALSVCGGHIGVEVLEMELLTDTRQNRQALHRMAQEGVHMAVDDVIPTHNSPNFSQLNLDLLHWILPDGYPYEIKIAREAYIGTDAEEVDQHVVELLRTYRPQYVTFEGAPDIQQRGANIQEAHPGVTILQQTNMCMATFA